jgi:YVTN family beta-propeller protein
VISTDATQSLQTNISMAGATFTGSAILGNGAVFATLANGGSRVITANADADTLSVTIASSPQSAAPTTITLPSGSRPVSIALAGSFAFVAFNNTGQVGVVNLSTLTFSTAIDLGGTGKVPVAMVATPDGKKVYVANSGDGTVGVIDVTSLSLVATVPFSSPSCSLPSWLTVTPDSHFVHVVCKGTNVVHIIDTTTNAQALSSGIAVGTNPVFAFFDPVKSRLLVVNNGSSNVTFLNENQADAANLHAAVNVPVGGNPVRATVLPDGTKAYVANATGTVTVIDNATLNPLSTLPVGGQPNFIASSSDSLRVAVTTVSPSTLTVIGTKGSAPQPDAISAQLPITGNPTWLLVNP